MAGEKVLHTFSRSRLVYGLKKGCPRTREFSTYPNTSKLIGEDGGGLIGKEGGLIGEGGSHHVTNGFILKSYNNRNPRSSELLGIADKPRGFATWNRRVDYYHRLLMDISNRHVSAYVSHNNGTKVVEASTKEFCISKHLYKTCDASAAFNIGRVVSCRCKAAGLGRVMWENKWDRDHKKVIAFIEGVRLEGLILDEPRQRMKPPEPGSLPRH